MRRKLATVSGVVILCLALVAISCAQQVAPPPQTAEEFYKNNTVNMVVGYGAGGMSTDYTGRMFSTFWSDVTGGAMIVKNMPAGGGIVGHNFVWNAKADGLTMGIAPIPTLLIQYLFKEQGLEFEPGKFNYIGAVSWEPFIVVLSPKITATSVADLQKMSDIKIVAGGLKTSYTVTEAILIDFFGLTKARIITGYPSGAEMSLALGRGEVDVGVFPAAMALDTIAKKYAQPKPLLVVDKQRFPLSKDTPALTELMKITPEQQPYFDLALSFIQTRAYFLPPDVPQDKLNFARDAFDKMAALKPYQEGMGRMGLPLAAVQGKLVADVLAKQLASITPEVVAKVNGQIEKYAGK